MKAEELSEEKVDEHPETQRDPVCQEDTFETTAIPGYEC
jgi:hypothetical protein